MILNTQPHPSREIIWDVVKWIVPTILSIAAFGITFYDRRSKLQVRGRKGCWYILRKRSTVRGSEVEFQGIVEIYNASSRANAIHSYAFHCKEPKGEWLLMDSERFEVLEIGPTGSKENLVFNKTPLTLAPYSGEEWRVMGSFCSSRQPYEMQVRVEIEDLFGKRSSTVVTAYS